jgi:hypothetical protein
MYVLSLLIRGPFFFYVVLVMKIPYLAYFQTHLGSTIVESHRLS